MQLFTHQLLGVDHIQQYNGRVLIADEMGLGKTAQALRVLQQNEGWQPAVVVCPASVKYNWEHEAIKVSNLRADICEGAKPPIYNRNRDSIAHSSLLIVNYDILKNWVDYLKQIKIKTVILDECHYLSNRSAKRTKAAKELVKSVDHVIALSGTPLTNRPAELYPVLNMLWPVRFKSFWTYAHRYCDPKWTHFGWDFSGSSNMDELHTVLTSLGMLRRKKEILRLPGKCRIVTPVTLRDPDQYQLATTNFMAWVRKYVGDRERKIKKVEKLARIGYLMRLAGKLKMQSTCEWANGWLREHPNDKLVLMAVHRKAIAVLEKRIDAKSVRIDGSVVGRLRQAAVDQFNHDSSTRLCVGNIKAAGTGINLTSARTLAFVEFWYNPGMHNQAEDRIHRIGQSKDVEIHYLVAQETHEKQICSLLQKRQEIISLAIDGQRIPEFNIYNELLKAIERGVR